MSSTIFFFQAEDGIRDHCVTGVQTCALPIFSISKNITLINGNAYIKIAPYPIKLTSHVRSWMRSEERRVGKECRCWWSRAHWKRRELAGGVVPRGCRRAAPKEWRRTQWWRGV